MSASGEHGKSALGCELREKSTEELMEILDRQEKLLSNQKFIAKLPDRGRKIREFAEKVRLAIAEGTEFNHKQELISRFKIDFQAKRRERENSMKVSSVHDSRNYEEKPLHKTAARAATSKALFTKDPPSLPGNHEKRYLHESSATNSKHIEAQSRSTAGIYSDPDSLLNDLEKISLRDGREEPNRVYTRERNPYHISGQKKSHFVEVIEKRAMNPVCKKEKFKTNKLPLSSSSSSSCSTPVDTKAKLTVEQRRELEKKHLNDITAATFPPLHHAPSQLLSLEESIALQMLQKQCYEEKQAKLAAQKLVERLHIKMEKFNPEGDSYMKYRDVRDDKEFES